MMRQLAVHLLPTLTDADELRGGTVVVIDVLRATTTIVAALAAGARAVVPCQEIDEARRLAGALPAGTALLGGERQGVRIDGFDLGNSPAEYTADRVGGRTIVFTTTNGTRALEQCRSAERVLCGAFVNLSALCAALGGGGPVHLLCAGTQGHITREDVLLSGAVVERLTGLSGAVSQPNDEAALALAAWRAATRLPDAVPLGDLLRESRGGRNLIATAQESDIRFAARVDALAVVPILDAKRREIRLR